MAEQTLVARFRKGDIVRWNALALHGDDRNGWTIEGLDEAKGLFPIYRVRKGKQTGSAVQSDLEPCPTHARLQREAQTSGAMAEDLVARLRAGAELQDTQYGWAPGDKLLGEAADEIERLQHENAEMRRTFGSHPLFEEKDREIERLRAREAELLAHVDEVMDKVRQRL